ncbi:uncharacterized protein LOC129249784 [Anastrepha obliqua]|uniref:uncharacterized protein LOC129249784 n=1 Tax=Anastrepha obliqua TaxID=95512 RepID=UPI00240A3D51|nr:uncharacterized protein LOC129249784 [Anastrepha obliqua]
MSKATKALKICKQLTGNSLDCSSKVLRWIYTMIIRPKIPYGAVAWGMRATLSTGLTMRTFSTTALAVVLELSPLHIVIQQSAKRSLFNMTSKEITNAITFKKSFRIELGIKEIWSASKHVSYTNIQMVRRHHEE